MTAAPAIQPEQDPAAVSTFAGEMAAVRSLLLELTESLKTLGEHASAAPFAYREARRILDQLLAATLPSRIATTVSQRDAEAAVVRAAIAWRDGPDLQQIGTDEIGMKLVDAVDALADGGAA